MPSSETVDALTRCPWGDSTDQMRQYHDTEWGVPVPGDRAMFERLSLEAFQSGLSWATILAKRENFRRAFDDFDPERVARFDERRREALLADAGIVRNRLKIDATIANAQALLDLDESLEALCWSFRPDVLPAPRTPAEVPTTSPESAALSKALKKRGFRFVGPTTMHALMEAVGIVDTHLVSCHRRGCGSRDSQVTDGA